MGTFQTARPASDNRAMSLAPPEAAGPLRRERLRTARLYFVCEALPGGAGSGAAAARGAERRRRHRPAAREGAGPGRRSSARRGPSAASATPTAPSSSSTTTPTWRGPATPTASTSARTTCPSTEAREILGPEAIIGLSTHSEEQLAASRRGAGRLRQRRPDLGDADQRGTARRRPRAGRARRRARPPSLLRDRRHRPGQRGRGRRGRGAAARRRARDPRRGGPGRRGRSAARRAGRRRGGRARCLSDASASASSAARRPSPRERMERGYARAEERNQEAREALEPLAEGERPLVVTIGAVVSALIVALDPRRLPRRRRGRRRADRALAQVLAPALLMGMMAWGMWRARYWAVLGFQLLLVLLIFSAVFGLACRRRASAAGRRHPRPARRRRHLLLLHGQGDGADPDARPAREQAAVLVVRARAWAR